MSNHLRASFTLATLLLTAWASAQKQDIVIWGVTLNPATKGTETVIRTFEDRHPQYRVRLINVGNGRTADQKLMMSIVGKVPPDVMYQDRFALPDWAARGAYRPLDDLIQRDQDKDPLCPKPTQYYPSVWSEASYAGKVYGIPAQADDRLLYWNRAMFRERAKELRAAGLDPNRAPRTWSELRAYNKVLTVKNPDGTLKQAGFLPLAGNAHLYIYAFENEAPLMSPDLRRCTLASPEVEQALQFIVDCTNDLGGPQALAQFQSGFQGLENDPFFIGKYAMRIDGNWSISGLTELAPNLDFATAPPPVPDDRLAKKGRFKNVKDPYVTWIGGSAYAIPEGARNLEGAWEFIKFVTSQEGRLLEASAQRSWDLQRGKVFVPSLTANIPANEQLFTKFKPADPKYADAIRMHIDFMKVGRIRPATFAGLALWNEHLRATDAAVLGTITPHDALERGQLAVQRELDAVFNQARYPVVSLVPLYLSIALVALLGALAAYISYRKARLGRLARADAKWGYLFVAPWVIGFLACTLGPMLASLYFSLTQFNGLQPARWVGPLNYRALVTEDLPLVTKAFSNVIYLAGFGVPLGIFSGLAVALLLNQAVRGIRFYRTAFYLPSIVPAVASAVLWIWLLNGDPNQGLINAGWRATLTQWFAVQPPAWLAAEEWAKPSLLLMGLWGAGGGMVLWLAGLKGIPVQLYEAASLDGATPAQQFWRVTWPQLTPLIFFNVVMGFIGAMQQFQAPFLLSGTSVAGPNDALLTPALHLFNSGFTYFKMGYASALAWVVFGVILMLTLVQFRAGKSWVHYEVES